mmetsp:Transcript_4661/g.16591  ORF Transcript_4661/g.16591 Transcript_4661/m.16591 type:complete len:354 (-) Transcript_4661:342-1403(-)
MSPDAAPGAGTHLARTGSRSHLRTSRTRAGPDGPATASRASAREPLSTPLSWPFARRPSTWFANASKCALNTFGAAAHTPSTAAHTLCRAACTVLPASIAAFARTGGAPASSTGRLPRSAKSRLSSADAASERTSAARPSASSSRASCDTATGDFRSIARSDVSMLSSAGVVDAAAAPVNGNACTTGSMNDTTPSNDAPIASSIADRPSALAAFASSGAPGASHASVVETRDAAEDAAAFGSSAVHSLVTSMRRARRVTHASRSSSLDSYSCSHWSPIAVGTPALDRPCATPAPCSSHVRVVSRSATTAPSGSFAAPAAAEEDDETSAAAAEAWVWACCAPYTPDPGPFPSGR